MTELSFSLPEKGEARSASDAKVKEGLSKTKEVVNGQLTTGNLSGSAAITDAQLASPNNSAYKVIAVQTAIGTLTTTLKGAATTGLQATFSATNAAQAIFLNPADYAVAGKTTKVKVQWAVLFGSTISEEPTATGGLYKVESATGLIATSAVSESTSTIAFGAAGSWAGILKATGAADFTMPSEGDYVFGIKTNKGSTGSTPVRIEVSYRNV